MNKSGGGKEALCQVCGKPMTRRSPAQKYHPECSKKKRKDYMQGFMREYRVKKARGGRL